MRNKIPAILAVVIAGCLLARPALGQDPDSVAAADSLLLEIQKRMGAFEAASEDKPAQAVVRSRPSTNPDISLIGDTRLWYVSEGERNVDLELHEVETSFKSVVDPFARADVFISAGNEGGEIVFDLEEAYLTTLSLPAQLQLRAGKFRSSVGKLNRLHPHSLPFVDTPAVYENFFGNEGLNDQGLGLSWLLPNASFYQELIVEVTRGPAESPSFETSERNRMLLTGHLKNFWEISSNATFELGLSGISGPNSTGNTTLIGGVDATYKWKPVQFNTYQSFTVQAEAFFSRLDTGSGEIKTSGFYAMASYQLARRWMLVGRYDHSDVPDDPDWNENGISGTVAWYLTEFQKMELGVGHSWGEHIDSMYTAVVRLIFVIGTHGAHEY